MPSLVFHPVDVFSPGPLILPVLFFFLTGFLPNTLTLIQVFLNYLLYQSALAGQNPRLAFASGIVIYLAVLVLLIGQL